MALACVVTASAAAAEEPSCAEALPIAGPADDVATLRAALARGPLAERHDAVCRRVRVALEPRANEWWLGMELDGDRVERDIARVEDAAAWVESWVLPLIAEPRGLPSKAGAAADDSGTTAGTEFGDSPASAAAPPTSENVAPPPRSPVLSGYAGMATVAAVGDDSSVWGGGELLGQLTVGDAAWLGVGFGGLIDTVLTEESAASDDLKRRLLKASVRAGGRLRLGSRVALDLGLGMGLVSALARHERDDGPTITDDEGAFLLEGLATAVIAPRGRWRLLVGLHGGGVAALEGSEDDEDDGFGSLPAAHPKALGGLLLGFGTGWGPN